MKRPDNANLLKWFNSTAGVAIIMILTSKLAMTLFISLGHASTIWTAAGISLAGVLLFGKRVWPGIFIATLLISFETLSHLEGSKTIGDIWLASSVISMGSVLQAIAGALFIRRFVGFPHRHDRMKDIFLMIIICGSLCSLINATVGTSILTWMNFMPDRFYQISWLGWWLSDFFEIAVIIPLVSAWVANMEHASFRSRLMVIIPVFAVLTSVIVASVYTRNAEWKKEKLMFERRSGDIAQSLWNRIETDIEVVFSLQSLFSSTDYISRQDFKQFVKRFLQNNPSIQALEWIPKVDKKRRWEFELRAFSDGFRDYQIRDLDTNGRLVQAPERETYYPVFYLEPLRGNETVIGYDQGSNPSRRAALMQARDTGRETVTGRIELVQESGLQFGILVFVPVYQNPDAVLSLAERRQQLTGFALGVFKLNNLVEHVLDTYDLSGMTIWLMDDSAPDGQRLLYANDPALVEEVLPDVITPAGSKHFDLNWTSRFVFAGRKWSIHFFPTTEFIASRKPIQSWTVLGFGLALTSLLGSFLLIVVGRSMVTQKLVIARTLELSTANKELQQEMIEREQAENRFRQSDSRVHAIMNSVVDGIITISQKGLIESFNPGAEKIFGYPKEETIGRNINMLMPEPYKSEHDQYLRNYLNTGVPKIIGMGQEMTGLKKDGSVFPIDLAVSRMQIDDELYFVGLVRDISERKASESQLNSSELRWQFALEGSQDGVLDWNLLSDQVFYSAGWKNMLGYTAAEIGDRMGEWESRLHPDDAESTKMATAAHLTGQSDHVEVEHRLRCKDGSYKWILNRGKVVEWTEDDKPARFISTHTDISDRKKREERLRRFQKAVDEGGYAIYITDIDGQIEYVNPAFSKITGYSEHDVLGENPRILKSDKMSEAYYIRLWKVLLNGQIWDEEIINQKKNGTIYHAHQTIAPIMNEKGVIEGFVAIQIDITELKQIDAALRENEALLKKAQEMAQLGSWKWDLTTDELEVSDEILRIYGLEDSNQKVTVNLLTKEMVHEDDRDFASNAAYRVRSELAQPDSMTIRIRRKNGEIRWITTTTPEVISYDQDGNPLVMLGTVQDVTDMKRIEEELRQARLAAEAANKAKSEFLANMSHEIRTPMNAVIGFSTLLSSMITDGKQKSYLDSINTAGKSLLTLINDILDLSKIEAGKLKLQYGPLNLKRLFDEIQQVFSIKMSEKNLEYRTEIDPALPQTLFLDETRIRQVLLNLMGNAIKFTDSGYIRLGAGLKKEKGKAVDVEIFIEDTGIGIPENQQQLIFDSFQQQDGQSTRKYGGTGLGLTISKRFVEMMNGRITVESKVGQGSLFRINLEEIQTSDTVEQPLDKQALQNLGDIRFAPARVLVADDMAINRHLLVEVLSRTGLSVLEAADGIEAITVVQQELPDVIIMDIVMPRLDGYEATRRLKDSPQTAHIPIIALTASVLMDARSKITQSGFDADLSKPLDIILLMEILSRFLTRLDKPSPQLVADEPGEADKSARSEIIDLEALLHVIETDIHPSWETLKGAIVVDDIERFAGQLSDLGTKHHAAALVRYAAKLNQMAQNFDISGIEVTLKGFSTVTRELKDRLRG